MFWQKKIVYFFYYSDRINVLYETVEPRSQLVWPLKTMGLMMTMIIIFITILILIIERGFSFF
jgi:hypothetical protein